MARRRASSQDKLNKEQSSDSSECDSSDEIESDEEWIPELADESDDDSSSENEDCDEDCDADEDCDGEDCDEDCDCDDAVWLAGNENARLNGFPNKNVNQNDEQEMFEELLNQLRQPRLLFLTNSNRNPPTRRQNTVPQALPPKKKKKSKPEPPKIPVDIDREIRTLDDLIDLAETIKIEPNQEYPFDYKKLKNLVIPLKSLRDLVGMDNIKQEIVEQILMLLSGLHTGHMLHTVLYGPPGSGKTTLALILSSIYQALGYSNGKFKTVKRSDLVAGYLGQTTLKTQKVIDAAQGGVLFIDEAYSLGDNENRDSFAKEMIDCLTQNLSEQSASFICIIAGYKEELEQCFFAVNPGLKRRFPFQYSILGYDGQGLAGIMQLMLRQQGWTLDVESVRLEEIGTTIQKYIKHFQHQGGDIENLVQRCQICHSTRIFGRHQVTKKCINRSDWEKGLKLFLAHKREEQGRQSSGAENNNGKKRRRSNTGSAEEIAIAQNYFQQLKRQKYL